MYILGRNLSFDWKAWLGWILATVVGIELCVLSLYHLMTYVLTKEWVVIGFPTIFAAAGTVLGSAQWFWLRKRSTMGAWWIAATVAGWYLALGGGFLLSLVTERIEGSGDKGQTILNPFLAWLAQILVLLVVSVLFALPQFFLLRRHVSRSGWWIAIRPLSWLAGWALCYLAAEWNVIGFDWFEPDRIFRFGVPEILGWCVFLLFFGTGFAAVTGAAMVLLQKNCSPGPGPQDYSVR